MDDCLGHLSFVDRGAAPTGSGISQLDAVPLPAQSPPRLNLYARTKVARLRGMKLAGQSSVAWERTPPMAASRTIYTVGSSTRTIDEFVELLRHSGVEFVVDVRRWPKSRFDHFVRERLQAHLSEAGIGYEWMGESLGGFRKGGYEAHMATDEFQEAIAQLERRAGAGRVAVMCSERLPWRCHRRFIGDALAQRGWHVVHVIDRGRTWQPKRPGEGQDGASDEGTAPTSSA
jgi:hypothetical protein